MGDGDGAWALFLVALMVVTVGIQWFIGTIIGPHSCEEDNSGNGAWAFAWLDAGWPGQGAI